jgi:hypothetical protein
VLNISTGLLCYVLYEDTIAREITRLIYFNLAAIVAALLLLTFDYYYISRQYPNWNTFKIQLPPGLRKAASRYRIYIKEFVKSSIRSKYTAESGQGNYRILFLGTSQIQGDGASSESKKIVNRIESKLNELNYGKTRYECLNTGFPRSNPYELTDIRVDYYMKELTKLNQKIVVFIIPTPFYDPNLLKFNELIQFNNSHEIKTIILVIAESIEYYSQDSPLPYNWKEFFDKNNLNVMGLNDYFIKNYDRGFLFWDRVHLTDYGQELAAAYIYKIIRQEIGTQPAI